MAAHSRFAPSAAERWVHCPPSIELCERFPELAESPHSAEGTAAHWVAFEVLHGSSPEINTPAPNGVLVTQEMLDGAGLYVSVIAGRITPTCIVSAEQRVSIPDIHEDAYGTPDYTIIEGPLLTIIDYKFGYGEVDPFENWQLAMYASGKISEHEGPITRVEFVVVQPRGYSRFGPVRRWITTPEQLSERMWPLLRAAATSTSSELVVGRHCLHCPARRACPALRRTAQYWGDYANASIAHELDAEALGIELRHAERALEMMQARVDAYREQAEFMARSGQRIPHYSLQPGRGSVNWTAPAAEILQVGQLVGVDLAKPAAPVTPTQARQKFKKLGIDDSVIDIYSERTAGALKLQLVPDSTDARIFSHVSD